MKSWSLGVSLALFGALAEARSGMKSWSLRASLPELGALAKARNGAWQWQGVDLSLYVLEFSIKLSVCLSVCLSWTVTAAMFDLDAAATCGDEDWLRF
jgi:hypothetical protein